MSITRLMLLEAELKNLRELVVIMRKDIQNISAERDHWCTAFQNSFKAK